MKHWNGTGQGGNPVRAGKYGSPENTTNISRQTDLFKDRPLPAAVFQHTDPRAIDAARVVPGGAQIVSYGNVVFGYLHEAAKPEKARKPQSWYTVRVKERRNELRKLVQYRYGRNVRYERYDIGPEHGWLLVLANLAVCMASSVSRDVIADMAAMIGYREPINEPLLKAIARDTVAAAVLIANYELLTPDDVGHLLEVTSVEREEAGLRKIGSIDETAEDRRKRLDRERKAKLRPRNKPTVTEIARAQGVSRSTYYRRKRAG